MLSVLRPFGMGGASRMDAMRKAERGFTLVEVVVAAGIFTFVAVMAVGIFAQTSRITIKVTADREVGQLSGAGHRYECGNLLVRPAGFGSGCVCFIPLRSGEG